MIGWLAALCTLLVWTLGTFRAWLAGARSRRPRSVRLAGVHVGVAMRHGKKPEWVTRQLVLLKAHLPEASCRTLALTFNRVFAHREVSVSKSCVHATLREHAHAVWLARKTIRQAKPRPAAINHCWGIDLTGRVDDAGKLHTVLGILDHGSRRVLSLRALPRKCGWTLLGHLCLAVAQFGRPRFVRTDNERCFTGRVFASGLRLLGIGHQHIDRSTLHRCIKSVDTIHGRQIDLQSLHGTRPLFLS